jgi:hypothetical protein
MLRSAVFGLPVFKVVASVSGNGLEEWSSNKYIEYDLIPIL